MSIQGLILDLSGTTFNLDGTVSSGMEDLLSFCKTENLKIAFTTNEQLFINFLRDSGLEYDIAVAPEDVGKPKPSPKFIEHIAQELDIPKEKFIYIGDDDFTDACCASNAKILYLSAKWANTNPQYGIPVQSPQSLIKIIREYFQKQIYWGWKLESVDSQDRPVVVFSILDVRSSLLFYARSALKRGNTAYLPFFLYHLISSIYLSGLYKGVDYWATYPSSKAGSSLNPTMSWVIDRFSKEFKTKYIDLFTRHTQAMDSGESRYRGIPVRFDNQINTVILNEDYRRKIRNKCILVLDDFLTRGFSLECARNLLYQADVASVICVPIGKYTREKYTQISIASDFNPFEPVDAENLEIQQQVVYGDMIDSMRTILEESFRLYCS